MLKIGSAANLPAFLAMDVAATATRLQAALPAGAPHIIRMEVGQPGFAAPLGARQVAMAALSAGATLGYTDSLGRISLRERISEHYADWYGETVEPARIAITTGASGAFPLVFLAAFNPGDRVALAAPYYPPYVNILRALGLVPVILPADAAARFQPTPALLDQLDPPPDGLIVASPGNPTGTMLHPDEFAALARWCGARGVRLISDEIYHGLNWSAALSTAAGVPGAVVINSFSKYFCMTGWRVGWVVLPPDLVRPVECLAQNFFICPPHISQVAAEAAFACQDELRQNLAQYRAARAHLLAALPEAGFHHLSPAEGAFYIYADVAEHTNDSLAWSARLLREAGVAVTPGIDFDAGRGAHFVRFSYCGPAADMHEATRRLQVFNAGGGG
jgi:aspartate/methionine/tyrosine aminotransferase